MLNETLENVIIILLFTIALFAIIIMDMGGKLHGFKNLFVVQYIVNTKNNEQLAMEEQQKQINEKYQEFKTEFNKKCLIISDSHQILLPENPPDTMEEMDFILTFFDDVENSDIEISDHDELDESIKETHLKLINESKENDIFSEYISAILHYIATKNVTKQFLLKIDNTNKNIKNAVQSIRKQQKIKYLKDFDGKTYSEYVQFCKENNKHPIQKETFNKIMDL